MIGAALFTVARGTGIMQYHLAGWDWAYHHCQPTKAVIHSAREWGRVNGLRYLHLGGGRGGSADDSLHEFKRGFSPDTHAYRTQRMVLDPARYVKLCGGDESTLENLDSYFPAYRRPGASLGPPCSTVPAHRVSDGVQWCDIRNRMQISGDPSRFGY